MQKITGYKESEPTEEQSERVLGLEGSSTGIQLFEKLKNLYNDRKESEECSDSCPK